MLNKKGQNTAEYAILIALVVAAAVAMQTYVKRSVQGGVKFTVDKLQRVDETGNRGLQQYEPEYMSSEYKNTQNAYQESEETKQGGGTERLVGGEGGKADKTSTRSGYQQTAAPTKPAPGTVK